MSQGSSDRRPLVFAHRGGCAIGPENTLAAFDLGLAAGADGLECDVHLSADGVPVVCHDATLDRTTDATGPVAARTAAALAGVDAGWAFAAGDGRHPFRGLGIGVPTLRQVLERYRDSQIIVEMKTDDPELGRRVAADVRATGAADRVCAAGEWPDSLRAARQALPEMMSSACRPEVRMAVYRSWVGWPVRRPAYSRYQVPELAGDTRIVSPRFVRHAHRAGLTVEVWTVDEADDMARLLSWGVDGLITNRPGVGVEVRNAFCAGRRQVPAGR